MAVEVEGVEDEVEAGGFAGSDEDAMTEGKGG